MFNWLLTVGFFGLTFLCQKTSMLVTRTKVSFSRKDYICFLAYIFCGFVLASFFPIGRHYCTTKIEFVLILSDSK